MKSKKKKSISNIKRIEIKHNKNNVSKDGFIRIHFKNGTILTVEGNQSLIVKK